MFLKVAHLGSLCCLPNLWQIQTFADRGANRNVSDNAVLPQYIVLLFCLNM